MIQDSSEGLMIECYPPLEKELLELEVKYTIFHIRLFMLLFVGGDLYEYSLTTKTNVFGMIIHA